MLVGSALDDNWLVATAQFYGRLYAPDNGNRFGSAAAELYWCLCAHSVDAGLSRTRAFWRP